MPVAFDASSSPASSINASPNPGTWTHTPVGTPRGVVVMMYDGLGTNPIITGVSYGGVPMTFLGFTPTSGEAGTGYVWHLGTGIPTGAQTVSVAHTGTSAGKWGVCATVTADRDTEVVGVGAVEGATVTDPAVSLDSGARSALRFIGGLTGNNDAHLVAAAAGCTILAAQDAGSRGGVFGRETTASTGATSVGFTIASDDAAMVAIAVAEVPDPAQVVRFDAVTESAEFTTTPDPFTFTHTPVGTPRGIAVYVLDGGFDVDTITSVSYGAQAMTRVDDATVAGENGSSYLYFLGTGIPTGAQTVSIDHTASATPKRAVCMSFAATADTAVLAFAALSSTSQANPSVTLNSGTDAAVRIFGGMSGLNDVDHLDEMTPGVDVIPVSAQDAIDRGFFVGRTANAATGSVAIGYTASADDIAAVGAAIGLAAVPDAPQDIAAVAVSPTQINVTWSPELGVTGYRVERSPDGTTGWATVATTTATTTADVGLASSTEFFYRVFSLDGVLESVASDVVSATTFEVDNDQPNPGPGGGVYYTPAYAASLVRRTPQASGPPILEEVAELAADGLNWSDELNREGQGSVTVAPQSLESPARQLLLEACSDDFDTPGLELWIHRGNLQVFAGPVVGIQPTSTPDTSTVTIHARGLLYYLRGMWIKHTTIDTRGTPVDQFTIVADTIDQWQSESYGSFGLDLTGVGTSGTLRRVNWRTNANHNVLERISELAERINGFDFWIDPETRALNLAASRGVDRTQAVVLERRNIENAQDWVSLAAGDLASEAFGINGTGAPLTAVSSDTGLRQSWGRWGVASTFSSTSRQTTLNNQTARLLADVSNPMLVPSSTSLIPVAGASATDFEPGDLVEYTFDHGFGEISVTRRVVAKRITVSSDGLESIGVDLA